MLKDEQTRQHIKELKDENKMKKIEFWDKNKDLFFTVLNDWLTKNNKTLHYSKEDVLNDYMMLSTSNLNDNKIIEETLNGEQDFIDSVNEWFDDSLNHGTYCNLVKATCKELGLTYKDLGEAIGYGEGAIKNASSSGKVSEPMQKAIELYKKTIILEKELENSNKIKNTLKEWLK